MGTDQPPYSLRFASRSDAEVLAGHRALMFLDMGSVTHEEAEPLLAASVPWFERLLGTQEYIAWLAICGEEIVSGGGIHLREMGPTPGCYRVGRWGHIMNIYTVPAHRRRGLARLLMATILEWSEANCIDQVTLTASEQGRPLYESLGFTAACDMRLPKKP